MDEYVVKNVRGDWGTIQEWIQAPHREYIDMYHAKIGGIPQLDPGPYLEAGLYRPDLSQGVVLQHDGSGYGYKLLAGVEGLGPAPVESTITPIAAGGGIRRHYRKTEGEIFLPIRYQGFMKSEIHAYAHDLAILAGVDGAPVDLVIKTDTTGYANRTKQMFYRSGMEIPTVYERGYIAYGLTFDYVDPYWYGDEQTQTVRLGDPMKPFITAPASGEAVPFLPVVLGNSSIEGRFTLRVDSELPVYPVWEITGPGNDLRIQVGKSVLELRGKVPENLTITTDPRTGIDITGDGATRGELWERVPLDSELAPLQPGRNNIRVQMTGAEGASSVTIRYRGRYTTPWR
ncbi:hypothetical protein [Pseudoglutamicibacter cumminsii]|uniref:hypothetical protein n=1 Tax=Pseudoglutamicibacter cumminsii TaxID=156979 RepID=UPI00195BEBB6|nr:hypothetical protein [Pseudoglutamicibacter cumminsii]MBM7796889.1 hypothetical protein [Pseudoglutamicibacter cumminsii]